MNDDCEIPLPLKLKRANAFSVEQVKPIIIISSKPLSNRAKDILFTAGYLRIFNHTKFCRCH